MVATSSLLSFLTVLSSSRHIDCDLSNANLALELPPNQTTLVAPSTPPDFLALGVGVQNYTCASTDTYTNVGAVAELFDISCLYGTPAFGGLTTSTFNEWTASSQNTFELIDEFEGKPIVLGQHYFIVNPVTGSGTSPKWDFTSARFNGNPEAFVVGAKIGDLPSPNGTSDIDWLQLDNVPNEGELATGIFRVETVGGVAPTSCTFGSSPDLQIKYTSQYWFFGSSL